MAGSSGSEAARIIRGVIGKLRTLVFLLAAVPVAPLALAAVVLASGADYRRLPVPDIEAPFDPCRPWSSAGRA